MPHPVTLGNDLRYLPPKPRKGLSDPLVIIAMVAVLCGTVYIIHTIASIGLSVKRSHVAEEQLKILKANEGEFFCA